MGANTAGVGATPEIPTLPVRPARSAAPVLVVCALVGGLLQILASIHLGIQRVDALTAAAQEGPGIYLLAVLGCGVGLGALWILRARPLVATVAFLLWQLAVLWPLAKRMTLLGVSLHGEFILHHFVALVAALACVAFATALANAPELGRLRWLGVFAVVIGVACGLTGHVGATLHMGVRIAPMLHAVATLTLVGSAILWFALDVHQHGSTPSRWAALPLFVPFVLKIVATGPLAQDAQIPAQWRGTITGVLIVCAFAITGLMRPRPNRPVAIAITISSALTIAMLYLVYRRDFGEVEDGLGGLVQTLIGFVPPYPQYVPSWALVVAMLGAFSALHTAAGAMATTLDRDRGTALALVLVTGIGLSSPQLALMTGAGLLAFAAHRARDDEASPPAFPLPELLQEVASKLGLSLATVPGARAGVELSALRGSMGGVAIDVRAQSGPKGRENQSGTSAARLRMRVGLQGRGRPLVALEPSVGDGGARPAHEIGRSHRLQGDPRELERWGDGLLDALFGLASVRARLWSTGAEIDFGGDLAQLDAARIERILRASVDVLRDE